PTVSTPVSWQEVEQCLHEKNPDLLVFTSEQVLQRVEKMGDVFDPVLRLKQKLPALEELDVPSVEHAPVRVPKSRGTSSAPPKRVARGTSRKRKTQDA